MRDYHLRHRQNGGDDMTRQTRMMGDFSLTCKRPLNRSLLVDLTNIKKLLVKLILTTKYQLFKCGITDTYAVGDMMAQQKRMVGDFSLTFRPYTIVKSISVYKFLNVIANTNCLGN